MRGSACGSEPRGAAEKKVSREMPRDLGQLMDADQGGVAGPAFHPGDVSAVEVRQLRKLFP
jgi:hypothetical protein